MLAVDSQTTVNIVTFSNPSDFSTANFLTDVQLGVSGSRNSTRAGTIGVVTLASGLSFSSSLNVSVATSYASGSNSLNFVWTLLNSSPGSIEYSYAANASPTNDPTASFLGLVVDPTTRLIGLEIRALDPVVVDLGGSNAMQFVLPTGWGTLTSTPTAFGTQLVSLNSSWGLDTSQDPSGFFDDGSNTYVSLANAIGDGSASNFQVVLWSDQFVPLAVTESYTIVGLGLGMVILIRGRRPRARRSRR